MPIGKIPQNGSRQMKPWDPECHRPNLYCAQFTYTDVTLTVGQLPAKSQSYTWLIYGPRLSGTTPHPNKML